MSTKFFISSSVLYAAVAIASLGSPVLAQNIIPSAETNTLVNQNNNLYTITGGVVTPDNFNGFHKFDIFNLDSGEIANFLTQQDLKNLFVGVNGGDPSIINGLIELTGSNANFFFANPAGIVFGQGASFNLPADLTVTTANHIGFGENDWFDIFQSNDYSTLLGDPTGFAFDALEPSAIINEGDIDLENGSLSFYGGGIASTGSIKAGKVTIQSVDGQTTARFLPEGSLIGVEVDITPEEQADISTSNISELNDLATVENVETGLELQDGDLTYLDQVVSNNDVVVRDVDADSLHINSPESINLIGGRIEVENKAEIIAVNKLVVRENPDTLFSIATGDDLTLQGTEIVDILALEDLSKPPIISGGDLNLISDGIISIDSHFLSGGSTNFFNTQNKPTAITSLYDPIISANGDVTFGTYGGAALKVEATGSIRSTELIAIERPDITLDPDSPDPDIRLLATERALILRAGVDPLALSQADNLPQLSEGSGANNPLTDFVSDNANTAPNGSIYVEGFINTSSVIEFNAGPVILEATGDIDIRNIFASRGDLNGELTGDAGDVTLNAGRSVVIRDRIESLIIRADNSNPDSSGSSGNISINAGEAIDIQCFLSDICFNLSAPFSTGNPGSLSLMADSINIAGDIFSRGNTTNSTGGSIILNASNGNLSVGNIESSGFNSGDISLTATGNIVAGTLISNPNFGDTGNITVNADNNLTLNGTDDSANVFNGVASVFSNAVSSGEINLIAEENITLNCPYNCLRVGADPNNLALTDSLPGSVSLDAGGSINFQNIFTGDTSGFSDSLPLFIDASNGLGDGGQISLRAVNDIQIGTMSVSSSGIGSSAGSIEITSTEGSVNTTIPELGDTVLAGRTLGTNAESPQSNAGSLRIEAADDITTGFIRFWSTQNGGTIDLISNNGGTIDTTAGQLETFSQEGGSAGSATLSTSGIINFGAFNDIDLINPPGDTDIQTISNASGANLTLNSATTNLFGDIDVSGDAPDGLLIFRNNVVVQDSISIVGDNIEFGGTLNSLDGTQSFTLTTGGDITFLDALGEDETFTGLALTGDEVNINQNITVNGDFVVNALANIAAASTLSAGTNSINLNGGLTANAGVTLEADNLALAGVFTGDANTLAIRPVTQSRDITLGSDVANTLSLTANEVGVFNGFTSVEITGTGDINIDAAIAPQDPLTLQTTGNININANITGTDDASLTMTAANVTADTETISTTGGAVNITADENITAIANMTTNGGNINLLSNNGNITTQNLDASNAGGVGGNVSLNALGNPQTIIETGDINTSGDTGGNIEIFAVERISAGQIISRGIVGDGGNVTIDPNSVDIVFIDAQGGGIGSGGAVDITVTGLFQATGAFIDDTGLLSSISTFGGAGSGPITIRHDGGDLFIPFIVGDPSINGTLGALNSGDFTINTFRVFPGSFFLGNISIITSDRFPNALDNAIDDTLPKIQEEVEAKDKGFFIDEFFTRQFESYFTGDPLADDIRIKSINEIQDTLGYIEGTTGVKPILVYGLFQPRSATRSCVDSQEINLENEGNFVPSDDNLYGQLANDQGESCFVNPRKFPPKDEDILTLVTVTDNKEISFSIVPNATRRSVWEEAKKFRRSVTQDPLDRFDRNKFQEYSSQFYKWLIDSLPLEEIEKTSDDEQLRNLTFILDDVLRSIPLAALGSTKNCNLDNPNSIECPFEYIINDYSVGLMPSMSLTETDYQPLVDFNMRLAGASKFKDEKNLEFVTRDIKEIANIWSEVSEDTQLDFRGLQESNFNIENVRKRQLDNPYGIVHLATHGNFDSKDNTYILFKQMVDNPDDFRNLEEIPDDYLRLLDNTNTEWEVRDMGWGNVNLLVLSACETAIDFSQENGNLVANRETELGFAGFAHRAETNSVLGSLWKIEDRTTGAIMARFYSEFIEAKAAEETIIKAEALRRAQLSMPNKKVYMEQGNIIWEKDGQKTTLLSHFSDDNADIDTLNSTIYDLTDPHYWSPYTMVGSPW